PARTARFLSLDEDAELPLLRHRIAGRRRLPGRRAPRLRGPEGDTGAASGEPDPGRERGKAIPAHGLLRLPPEAERLGGEIRTGGERNRGQEAVVARFRQAEAHL